MWVPLGIGVTGFLSGMALAASNNILLNEHSRPCVCIFRRKIILQVCHAGSHNQQRSYKNQRYYFTSPQGAFAFETLLSFAGYSFITSMPVLSFMVFVSSRFKNMWVPQLEKAHTRHLPIHSAGI